jgi:hypothetical protein
MRSLRIAILAPAILILSLAVLDSIPAVATTCESTCNQLRRACRRVAKVELALRFAGCDADRDTCRATCESNASQCPIDCQSAHADCVASGGVDCDAQLAQCLEDCADCIPNCNAARVACRDAAKVARAEADLACDAARESCGTACVDPIDQRCVRACQTTRRDCDLNAKQDEKSCRAACPQGTGRRACMRDCGRDKNAALSVCSDAEVVCLSTCAGLTP